jgi:succinyl-diaminopimelate desuccinylase
MKTEAERQLAELVSMPTITDDIVANGMCLDYIQEYLAGRGMHTERFNLMGHGALVASSRTGNAKNPAVLLAGHVDVTPAETHLFKLEKRDGKLFGRGVYDMKGAVAAYMQLVDDLKDRLADYDFAIMLTTDEEYGGRTGSNGTRDLVAAGYRAGICILPDSAAPGWDVEKVAKAAWRFELVAKGKAAHGSRPWEGESASFKLIQALHELRERFKGHGPETDILNIGLIHGGEAFNQIPANMTAGVEIRFIDLATYPVHLKYIQEICTKYDVTYVEHVVNTPAKADLTSPLLVAYADSVQKVTGRRPEPIISMAGTDAQFFVQAGVPYIVSCPQGGGHHGPNEWIDHQSYLQFVPILRTFLDKVARQKAARKQMASVSSK